MAYLHRTIQQLQQGAVAGMSAQDMATYMKKAVLSVSIKLHMPPWDRADILSEISGTWDRWFSIFVSFITSAKQGVLEAAHTFSLETLQPQPAEAAQHQQAQAAMLVPLLDLSEQQQEFIAVGMRMYYDIVQGMHKERQQLQLQVAVCHADMDSKQPQRSGSCDSCSSSILMSSLDERQVQLERQEVLTNRLNVLLHKEYMLRMTAMGWFVGCLSYEQLSKLAVLSWPYPMRVLFLATEIMQHREELLKTRMQMMQ